jgi:uncharacterized membrane protein
MKKNPFFKRNEKLYMFLVCFGIVLIGAGSVVKGSGIEPRFFEFAAGIGSAAVGLGAVGLILIRKKPETVQQQEIEQNDERNIKIREKSAYGTFFVMMLALLAAEIAFLVLDMWLACLVVIGVMAVHVGSFLILLYINNKRL